MIDVICTPYPRTVKICPPHGAFKQCYDLVSSRDERESVTENKLGVIQYDDLSDAYKVKKGILVIHFSCFVKYKQRVTLSGKALLLCEKYLSGLNNHSEQKYLSGLRHLSGSDSLSGEVDSGKSLSDAYQKGILARITYCVVVINFILKMARRRASSSVAGSEDELNVIPVNEVGHRKRLREFTGTDQGPSVDEFISRFEVLSNLKGWDDETKANEFLASCTGKAYSFLNRVPLPSQNKFHTLRSELQNAYGLTLEKAIFGLHNRKLNSGENVYDFASDLRRYVEVCLPTLSEQDQSKVAALTYWYGLNQTETIRQLFSSWKQAGSRSLEEAIALTRETAESLETQAYL